MIEKSSNAIQYIQQLLKRTHKGRTIREEASAAVDVWKENIGSEYEKSECQMCGLILKSNYFVNGCLNCGSTDVKPIQGI